MKEAPNIITKKDLQYLEDMFEWNLLMNKKLYSYLDCVDDDDTIKLMNKIRKMHLNHYNKLLGILE